MSNNHTHHDPAPEGYYSVAELQARWGCGRTKANKAYEFIHAPGFPPPTPTRPASIDPYRIRDHHDPSDGNRRLTNHCHLTARQSWVVPNIGDVRVDQWRPRHCEAVLAAATGHIDRERLQGLRASMRAMVTRGQKEGWIPLGDAYDPLWKVTVVGAKAMDEPIDRSLLPTVRECQKMELAMTEVLGPDWGMGLWLVAETMVRWGEFIALRPECVRFLDSDGEPLRAVALSDAIAERKGRFKEKDLKNHYNRVTGFCSDIVPDLEDFIARSTPGQPLFVRPDGKTPDRSWWSRRWRKALNIAGFEDSGWALHTWRHVGACVWLFDRRADPPAVSAALGHFSVSFTLSRCTGAWGAVARSLTAVS